MALAKVPNKDTGVASSLLNTGQQVGGSIGLAILGTVAWSAVASNTKSAIAATHGAHLSAAAQTALANHALAYGFGRGYLVSAGISFLAVIIALAMIRVKRADMAGIDPMAAPVLDAEADAEAYSIPELATRRSLPAYPVRTALAYRREARAVPGSAQCRGVLPAAANRLYDLVYG